MTDARLQALYRRLAATRDDISSEDLVDALGRHGYPDVENTPLDRIAASKAHADILRTAIAMAPEAEALGREVASLRATPHARPAVRRLLALAASVAALGVVIVMQRASDVPVVPEPLPAHATVILSASFEAAPGQDTEMNETRPIFRGGFDS